MIAFVLRHFHEKHCFEFDRYRSLHDTVTVLFEVIHVQHNGESGAQRLQGLFVFLLFFWLGGGGGGSLQIYE